MDSSHKTTVDIVVPTRDRGTAVVDLIKSLQLSTYRGFKVWVVDQSNDDHTENAVRTLMNTDRRIKYIRSSQIGSNNARVTGINAGSADIVVFTDDDCRVAQNWLECLIKELHLDDTWAVFGRVLSDNINRKRRGANEFAVTDAISLATKVSEDRLDYQHDRLNLGFGHSNNMAIRRNRYYEVGGFDPLLGAGAPLKSWPERDLGYRILRVGGKITYTPDAIVYHWHWRPWKEVDASLRNYGFGAGAAVSKYIRCGDWLAIYLLYEWIIDQGVRQIISGIVKWRSKQKVLAGLYQLIYPWYGMLYALRFPVDRQKVIYHPLKLSQEQAKQDNQQESTP